MNGTPPNSTKVDTTNGTPPNSTKVDTTNCGKIAEKLHSTTIKIKKLKALISMYRAFEPSEDLGGIAAHLAQGYESDINKLKALHNGLLQQILQCPTNKQGPYSYSRNSRQKFS